MEERSAGNPEKEKIDARLAEIETAMYAADFWTDKAKAQAMIKEMQDLKDAKEGVGKYDKGNAIVTIFAGAGGDDAEDWARMLFDMYRSFSEKNGWKMELISESKTDSGGYRSITVELLGKGVYGKLKSESGVHRLVRISPFNAGGKRQTSFAMVEIIPKFETLDEFSLPEDEVQVDFTRSGGPGGQNVNKRETAVRAVHVPTGLSVHIDSQRSQGQNKELALEILAAKLYTKMEEERKAKESGMYVSKTTDAEWGSQIRSYVLHPYRLVKDHRTGVESHDPEAVLDGEIEPFLVENTN
jgi:peptide chain release factor 2